MLNSTINNILTHYTPLSSTFALPEPKFCSSQKVDTFSFRDYTQKLDWEANYIRLNQILTDMLKNPNEYAVTYKKVTCNERQTDLRIEIRPKNATLVEKAKKSMQLGFTVVKNSPLTLNKPVVMFFSFMPLYQTYHNEAGEMINPPKHSSNWKEGLHNSRLYGFSNHRNQKTGNGFKLIKNKALNRWLNLFRALPTTTEVEPWIQEYDKNLCALVSQLIQQEGLEKDIQEMFAHKV